MRALRPLARAALRAAAAALLVLPAAAAQGAPKGPDPVHVSVTGPTEPVPAGGRFEVVLRAEIDSPWHIYAHDSPGGVLPTAIVAAPVEGEPGAGLALERIVQPEDAAQTHYDAILEETHKTLEGTVEFKAVFTVAAGAQPGDRQVEMSAEYMACNADGCLFPVTKGGRATVTVAGVAAAADEQAVPSGIGEAGEADERDDGPIGPDPVHVSAEGPKEPVPAGGRFEVVLRAEIDPPYHIFAHDSEGEILPAKVEAGPAAGAAGAGLTLARIVQPDAAARIVRNETLEETYRILEGTVEFRALLEVAADAAPGERVVTVGLDYQACNEQGCLFPVTKTEEVRVTVRERRAGETVGAEPGSAASGAADAGAADAGASRGAPAGNGSLEGRLSDALMQGDIGGLLWLSLVFGFVSLLTPCVFPMIPITVSFFSKRAGEAGGGGARYALAYGLGIMATYTGFGMAMAALLGASSLQALATDPWANLAIGALFVFFGLSLMGFYDLKPPAFLVRRAEGGVAARPGYAPVFVMGFIFTITAFTCTAPIVGSLLAALAAGGSPLLIALGMLVYSAAFALPFVLLAAFPGMVQSLPGAGGWMVTLKVFLGFIEIVAALKFFSNTDLVWDLQILTRPVMLAATLLLLGALALYLLGAYRLPHDMGGRRKGFSTRLIVAIGVLLAFLYLARGLSGKELDSWTESYLPPRGYGEDAAAVQAAEPIAWVYDYQAALKLAAERGVPIFIDFTGITCQNCRIVEKTIFREPRFVEASRGYVMVKLYTDRRSPEHKPGDLANQKLMATFGSVTLPLYVLLGSDGKVRATMGFTIGDTVDDFLAFLETPGP